LKIFSSKNQKPKNQGFLVPILSIFWVNREFEMRKNGRSPFSEFQTRGLRNKMRDKVPETPV
jgi:hypothetical protein